MSDPIYAIGDIHGQNAMLHDALALVERDGGRDATLVFLGDYVDRGPDSRGVLDTLLTGLAAGRNWVCLKGNHDRMFEWYLETPPRHDPHLLVGYHWFHDRIGGRETAASYGSLDPERRRMTEVAAEMRSLVPPAHTDFLRGLPLIHHAGDLAFVHAGIRPGIPLHAQEEMDLLWIRQEFHADPSPHPALIVHGHTPVAEATHYGNRVNLDTGAGYGQPLSVAVFEAGEVWRLTDKGRQRLTPDRSA